MPSPLMIMLMPPQRATLMVPTFSDGFVTLRAFLPIAAMVLRLAPESLISSRAG